MQIYKYPLKLKASHTVELPQGAKILSVQEQNDAVFFWALVDPELKTSDFHFQCFNTGYPCIPDELGDFVATIEEGEAKHIWHIFVQEL